MADGERIVYLDGNPTPQIFPADASDAQISAALKAIPKANAPNAPKAKTWTDLALTAAHGATAALPVVGGIAGGMIGSGASPIVGTAAGIGAGTTLGAAARDVINEYVLGDRQPDHARQVASQLGEGAVAGVLGGTMAGLPVVASAMSPRAVLTDMAAGGQKGVTTRVLSGAAKRALAKVEPQGPVLRRPAWQAAEAPPEPPSPVERYMPNVSSPNQVPPVEQGPLPRSSVERYMPNTPASQTGPLPRGYPQVPRPAEVQIERYAPNASSPNASAAIPAAPGEATAGVHTQMPQATWTQLENGEWGIKGAGLKPGDSVHVMNRAGQGQMVKVGPISSDANGVQVAQIDVGPLAQTSAAQGAAPKMHISVEQGNLIKGLIKSGMSEADAVRTVVNSAVRWGRP